MNYTDRERVAIDANKQFFDNDASDFNVIHDDPSKIGNWLTRLVTKYYCKDHIKLRMNTIVAMVRGGMAGKRVCELGCGPGRYALHYLGAGASAVVGVDYSLEMLRLAEANRSAAGVAEADCRFVQGDVLDFTPDEPFDVCVASGLIDYLPNHLGRKLTERMAANVCQGGQVIITFPMKGGLFNTIRKPLRRLQNVHTFYYSNDEVVEFLAAAGLDQDAAMDITGYKIVSGVKRRPGSPDAPRLEQP